MHDDEFEEANTLMGIGVKWFLVAVCVLALGGWIAHTVGLFGKTIVERKVFENSYQYSEARKAEIATLEAQLAEIDMVLKSPDTEETTKRNLRAQKSAINIRLRAARDRNEQVLLKQ